LHWFPAAAFLSLRRVEVAEEDGRAHTAHVDPAQDRLGTPTYEYQLGHAAELELTDSVPVDDPQPEADFPAVVHSSTREAGFMPLVCNMTNCAPNRGALVRKAQRVAEKRHPYATREKFLLGRRAAPDYSRRMSTTRMASALVGAIGIAIAAGVGYLLHKEARQRSEAQRGGDDRAGSHRRARARAEDAFGRGRLEGRGQPARGARAGTTPELVQDTEPYLVGVREILRRRTDASRLEQKAAKSRAALVAHMSRSERRDTPWIRAAMDLKKQVERDHFDLDVQLMALSDLLGSLPEANKRLAPHVQASLLLEDAKRRSARDAVLAEAKRARDELGQGQSPPQV
jgi:hypothetical protein